MAARAPPPPRRLEITADNAADSYMRSMKRVLDEQAAAKLASEQAAKDQAAKDLAAREKAAKKAEKAKAKPVKKAKKKG